MKIRNGFVSNSSSSSFICEICNRNESGWDIGLSEAEMVECTEGHVMCESHIDKKKWIKEEKKYLVEHGEYENEEDINEVDIDLDEYEFPSEACPICNLEIISDTNLLDFELSRQSFDREKIAEDIRSHFKTLKELKQYLKK